MRDGIQLRLLQAAEAFHDSLIRTDCSGTPLKRFPRECCNHACNLLGVFLAEQGFSNINRIYGGRPVKTDGYGGHVWLEVEGFIVDITAYQFDEVETPVIVTAESEWHNRLNGRSNRFDEYDDSLQECTKRIKADLNAICDNVYDRVAKTALELLVE